MSDKNTKNHVILHLFDITGCLILETCRQKLKMKFSNVVNIVVKRLTLKLSSHRSKLEIYLVLKHQCLIIYDLSLSTG